MCRAATHIVHVVEITRPAICPRCFRILSDKIFDEYNPVIAEYEEMIREAEERNEKKEHENTQKCIHSEIVLLKHKVETKKANRDAEAAGLRERYGVWRDG